MLNDNYISGRARVAGVMGWPVAHSRSPLLHNFWLRRAKIDGLYLPMPVPPHRLAEALRALPALGFKGCNITLPHKEEALAQMDEVDDLVKKVGAVNTVIVGEDGRLHGRNTDVYGFTTNLETAGKAWKKRKPAAVIGAGGAARAVLVALHEEGAGELRLINRTHDRALELARSLNPLCGNIIKVFGWTDRHDALEGAHLLVNTTTQGMQGQPPLDISLRALDDGALVTDLVYTPLLTPLLVEARKRGHPIVDGLGMLLHQAAPGFEAWFGMRPVVDAQTRALLEGTL